jgi:hypothetical protein
MVHLQLMTMYLYFHLIYSIFIVHFNQDLIKNQVKLINQVNQRQQQGDEILGYKLYQIKHEEMLLQHQLPNNKHQKQQHQQYYQQHQVQD